MSPGDNAEILLRPKAEEDLDRAVSWLLEHAPAGAAITFVDALESAFALLARHPLAGSGSIAIRAGVPDLRVLPVPDSPYLIVYIGTARRVDIVRVLHSRRDVDEELIGY